jgi:hypothetical protein
MNSKLKRREFIKKSSKWCMGGCLLLSAPASFTIQSRDGEPIDPELLCYCGYQCPEDCHFLVATLQDDPELKEEVFEEWELEKRYGLKFDPQKIFCFKCKPGENPEGPVLNHCTVRTCAIGKGYQACIQCDQLQACDKELWTRFPQFHEAVVEIQKKYKLQGSS